MNICIYDAFSYNKCCKKKSSKEKIIESYFNRAGQLDVSEHTHTQHICICVCARLYICAHKFS